MATLHLSDVSFTRAPERLRTTGLLGWVQATLDDRLGLDGISVRRSKSGRLVLSFPTRIDRRGRARSVIWPLHDEARQEFEIRVLAALDAQGVLP